MHHPLPRVQRHQADVDRLLRMHEDGVAEEPVVSHDTAEASERAELLWRAIDDLPDKLRIVIVLGSIQGHDIRELATLLELPEGTVKSRLFLARQQLKERLSWMAEDQNR